MESTMAKFDCYKCGGSGKIGAFAHIENGTCFTCGGAGKLDYQKQEKAWIDPHPDWLVAAEQRSTIKQWEYLAKLCGDHSDPVCRVLEAAGAPSATQRYVSKIVMSKAIVSAKRDESAAKWRKANGTMAGALQ
jgi:hypothetical protein